MLNENGDVVGDSTTASGEQHGFLWRDGKMNELGTFGGSVAASFGGVANERFEPRAINAHGTIVGLVHDPVGSYETAFVWRDGKLSTLGGFGGEPNALSDLDADEIVSVLLDGLLVPTTTTGETT